MGYVDFSRPVDRHGGSSLEAAFATAGKES